MVDFNHGNIKWDTLQSTGVEDQKLLGLVQDNLLTQHVLEPTMESNEGIRYSVVFTERIC